jgi:magnesium transporter
MLGAYPTTVTQGGALANARWVDLVDPTPEERAAFEQAFGLRVPTKEQLAEIETTSRLQLEKDALYLTAPLIFAVDNEPWTLVPTGFVLSKRVLLTVRFAKSIACEKVIKELGDADKIDPAFAFVRLLQELVDRVADLLEGTVHDLDEASHVIFRPDAKGVRLAREAALLRRLMIRTGRTSERMARVQYSLICLDRIAKFTVDRGRDWIASELTSQLQTISSDITSLVQFAEALVSRVQLLQDAATGIINIDQNEVMKVLTVASVVGIPPVVVVGIYGMNFKNMPELNWAWGYPFAVALAIITALVPLAWFRWKKWI